MNAIKMKRILINICKYVLLIFAAFVALVPIVSCIFTAFKTEQEYANTNVITLPKSFLNFDNFIIAWNKANMGKAFLNSFIILICVLVGSIMISAMLAYVLNRFKFPGNKLIRNLFTIATLIPAGLFFSAGLLCLAFAQDLTWFIISGILIGIGQNGISPVLMTISMRTVPAERKAAANSTNYLGMDIGSALASTVGGVSMRRKKTMLVGVASGVLCAVFGYRVGFAAFVVPVVLAVALAVVILSRLEKQERTA